MLLSSPLGYATVTVGTVGLTLPPPGPPACWLSFLRGLMPGKKHCLGAFLPSWLCANPGDLGPTLGRVKWRASLGLWLVLTSAFDN